MKFSCRDTHNSQKQTKSQLHRYSLFGVREVKGPARGRDTPISKFYSNVANSCCSVTKRTEIQQQDGYEEQTGKTRCQNGTPKDTQIMNIPVFFKGGSC